MDKSYYSGLQVLRFSHNNGTSLMEVAFLTQIPMILNYLSVGCLFMLHPTLRKDFTCLRFVFEFLCIILPLIIFLTSSSHLLFLFYVCSVITILILPVIQKNRKDSWSSLRSDIIVDDKLPCVTVFRAIVNIFTIICILAADFECFPRRFLKTESYGYGLMDTGVGLFVVIYSFSDSPSKPRRPLRYSAYKILPLFILGLGRYMCTEALNYHHQITEYGTQWNFFMTLSAITLFNEIFLRLIKSFTALFISTVLFLVIHESCLTLGLKQWILSDAPRLDFISGNREGVFSLMGYEVLYLSGMMLSHFLPRKNDLYKRYITILPQYFLGFLLCTTFTKLMEFSVGVSRRTANAGYIFWVLSLSFLTFTTIFFCDIVLRLCIHGKAIHVDSASLITKAVNYNGLFFFLFGNVLTGFINLSTKTLLLNEVLGVFIISTYTFVCCGFVVFLHTKNIRLR